LFTPWLTPPIKRGSFYNKCIKPYLSAQPFRFIIISKARGDVVIELRKIRTLKGLTQQHVADTLQCSATVYARYGCWEYEPSIETLLRLSAFGKVMVDCLLRNGRDMLPYLTYELDMLMVARETDGRTREDVLNRLLSHRTKNREF
ncbi:MAG: helix-turn-helix transcriptional regulator, partial [Lachnospiraceae bacterium]|nr:helix-turn-helix transcriptional regulator [Lachnospiraceae bacterium]